MTHKAKRIAIIAVTCNDTLHNLPITALFLTDTLHNLPITALFLTDSMLSIDVSHAPCAVVGTIMESLISPFP
jgi:hypothetical protein